MAEYEYQDGSDVLMKKKLLGLYFFHVASGIESSFKAFLTSYDDNFSSEWSSERVYGRMDPIHTFQGTTRTISLAWDVPSADFTEAEKNFKNATSMYSMLYPAYSAGIITAPPLIKLKFANLIYDASVTFEGSAAAGAKTAGLLGWLAELSFAPDLDAGFFDEKPGFLIPQTIKLNCTFNVLHQHPLGWNADDAGKLRKAGKEAGSSNFPYNAEHHEKRVEKPKKKKNQYPDEPRNTAKLDEVLGGGNTSRAS